MISAADGKQHRPVPAVPAAGLSVRPAEPVRLLCFGHHQRLGPGERLRARLVESLTSVIDCESRLSRLSKAYAEKKLHFGEWSKAINWLDEAARADRQIVRTQMELRGIRSAPTSQLRSSKPLYESRLITLREQKREAQRTVEQFDVEIQRAAEKFAPMSSDEAADIDRCMDDLPEVSAIGPSADESS